MPLAITLVGMYASGARRAIYLGVLGGISGLGAVGPFIGGLIVAAWTWQMIFWVNVPIGLLLTIVALSALPADPRAAVRLDLAGFVTASLGMFPVVLGIPSLTRTASRTESWNHSLRA